ncbi:hypothetical protein EGP95_04615 [bacterium]|jgi:hypothetical protein|nr:hypothetical protein [bacterium]
MIFGKYGQMILSNMEKNYPYRKQELELTGELNVKIYEREQYILKLKEKLENEIKTEYKEPKTSEMYVIAKYQQMIDGLVDEILMNEVLVKI